MVKTKTNLVQITCYTKCSMFVTSNGEVYGFGSNSRGRMGLASDSDFELPTQVPNLVNIVRIESGYFHSLALD